uniref:Pentatricopeptide repeat-containing protein At5g66520 n=1 Tax=Anthurium amnicola TaxID=1678845 RepID=A0A1D1XS08_9ARAE
MAMASHLAGCVTRLPSSVFPPESRPSSAPSRRRLDLALLKACSHLREFRQCHGQMVKSPFERSQTGMAKLIEALAGFGHMVYARRVFEELHEPSTFVFNNMIKGYELCGEGQEGVLLYTQMRDLGVSPDSFTYPFLLKACTSLEQGKGVHSLILKHGHLMPGVYSQTFLVTFYSVNGDLQSARLAFDRMPERNVVSWTAMITGYVKHKRYSDGLLLFHQMQAAGIEPNEMTLVNVLCACAHLGALEMGRWVHRYINKNITSANPTLRTALVDMYMKCGNVGCASQVFEQVPVRDVCIWNAMIGGMAMTGHGERALVMFSEMVSCGARPDDITFMAVLSACRHSGLVGEGKFFFNLMRDYRIEPSIKHYGCLLDVLGWAGLLDEVWEIVNLMPMEPNAVIWGVVLNCCRAHGNVGLAEVAMKRLVELEPFNDGNYVLMSNIYASKGQWDDVAEVRRSMRDKGISKAPGCSSIEVNGDVHEFVAGCSTHPRAKEIYDMLHDMTERFKAQGYVPSTSHVLHDTSEEDKEQALCHHSEKLAIAFGLISTEPGTPLRIFKNLRACEDCHLATKLVSKAYNREIVVRDRHRFHHFKHGACSCNDFW